MLGVDSKQEVKKSVAKYGFTLVHLRLEHRSCTMNLQRVMYNTERLAIYGPLE